MRRLTERSWRPLVTLALLAGSALALTCTRTNPRYCEDSSECADGLMCHPGLHSCVESTACADGGCMCDASDECPDATPICEDLVCVECLPGAAGDELCAGRGGGTDHCVAGGCHECEISDDCPATAPHCDAASLTCGPCRADLECDSGVCDEGAGACLEDAALLFVAPDGMDMMTDCTRAEPCKTVRAALDRVESGRATIVVAAGDTVYTESIDFEADAYPVDRVTIVGQVGQLPSLAPVVDRPALDVRKAGAALVLERLELRDGNRSGVVCRDAANLTLVEVIVRGHEDLGVDAADGCTLAVHRSRVTGNHGGGLSIADSPNLSLQNTIVTANGDGTGSLTGGLSIQGSIGVVQFNTIVGNEIDEPLAAGVHCFGDTVLTSNILWDNVPTGGALPSNVGGSCVHRYSVINGAVPGPIDGGENIAGDPALDDDLHLGEGSSALDSADPDAELAIDIDGDVRPIGAGRDRGADERP